MVHRLAVAGGLGQADVPGDDRGKDLAGEVALDLLGHLHGQVGAAVVHGQQQTLDLDGRVQPAFDNADGGDQVAQALQGIVLTLDGHQDRVGGAQAVQGEKLQRGRAVDENEVIVIGHLGQSFLQEKLPIGHPDHFHGGTGQRFVGREHMGVGGLHDGLLHRGTADEHIVDGGEHCSLVYAEARGGIALGVKVADQHTSTGRLKAGAQTDTAGGLAHAAFLID